MKKIVYILLVIILVSVYTENIFAIENEDSENEKKVVVFPVEVYEDLFEEAGINVSDNAVFGITEFEVYSEDNTREDTVEVAYMFSKTENRVDYSVLMTFKEGTNQVVDAVDFQTLAYERINSNVEARSLGSDSGTYSNVTATVSYYYYMKSGASTYLYKPRQLSFVSTKKQTVEASYYIGGALYNGQSQSLNDEGCHEIYMPSRTATSGTTYSKQATTTYYYQVHQGGGGYMGHQLSLIVNGNLYRKDLADGFEV